MDTATGKLLAFLDSDDYWPEHYLETMTSALQEHPECILAYCMTAFVESDGGLRNALPVERCKSGSVTQDLFEHHFISPIGAVIRSRSIQGLRFDEGLRSMEDPDFFLRLSLKGDFLFVDGIKVPRTDSPGSLSKGSSENALLVRERFFYELGGNECIDSAVAFRKMSRICLRLGKKHYDAGHYPKAEDLFRKAFKYHPLALRPPVYFLLAALRRVF